MTQYALKCNTCGVVTVLPTHDDDGECGHLRLTDSIWLTPFWHGKGGGLESAPEYVGITDHRGGDFIKIPETAPVPVPRQSADPKAWLHAPTSPVGPACPRCKEKNTHQVNSGWGCWRCGHNF